MAGWSRAGSLQRPGVGTGQEEKTATPSEVLDSNASRSARARTRAGSPLSRGDDRESWRSCDGSACARLADAGYFSISKVAKGSVTTAASTGAALAAPAPARPLRGTGCRAPRSCRAHRCRLRSGLGRDARASRPSAAARTARRSAPSTTAATPRPLPSPLRPSRGSAVLSPGSRHRPSRSAPAPTPESRWAHLRRSVIVSVCGSGASRPAAPVAAALTRARRFGSSTSLSTAVTVTRPVLSVLPAAIVSSRFALNAKSSASAGDTGDAEPVTVTSPVVAPLSCAVTRLSPPSSEIRSGTAPASRSAPRRLSSVIVSLSAGGSVSPPGPVTAAVTVNRQRPVGAQLEVRRDRG